jgi:hypothetical protein
LKISGAADGGTDPGSGRPTPPLSQAWKATIHDPQSRKRVQLLTGSAQPDADLNKITTFLVVENQADEEIRTLDPLLGKEMLYH